MFLIPHHCIFCEAGSRKAIQKYVFWTARLKMKVGLMKDCWNIKNEDYIQWNTSLIQMSIMGTFIFSNKFMGTNIQVILNIFTSAIYLSSSFLCADNLVRNENVWVNKSTIICKHISVLIWTDKNLYSEFISRLCSL